MGRPDKPGDDGFGWCLFAGVPGQGLVDAEVDGAQVDALRFAGFARGGGEGAVAMAVAIAGLAAALTFGGRAQHVVGFRAQRYSNLQNL
jgi:hypothetical protein